MTRKSDNKVDPSLMPEPGQDSSESSGQVLPRSSRRTDDDRKIGEFDEIRVGPLCITTTPDGGAGIWIGDASKAMIAIFNCSGQTGIGIYHSKTTNACAIALAVDDKTGEPIVQFAQGDEVLHVGMDQIRNLFGTPASTKGTPVLHAHPEAAKAEEKSEVAEQG